jgi:hypothetical protein
MAPQMGVVQVVFAEPMPGRYLQQQQQQQQASTWVKGVATWPLKGGSRQDIKGNSSQLLDEDLLGVEPDECMARYQPHIPTMPLTDLAVMSANTTSHGTPAWRQANATSCNADALTKHV